MSEIDITVRGSHTVRLPPERAAVTLGVAVDADDKVAAYRDVAASADQVRSAIEALHDPRHGPVVSWASEQIHTWSTRPWNQDGKVLPLVHHARVTFTAQFADFAALSELIAETSDLAGASVVGIEWSLTDAHHLEVVADVRRTAVLDAVAKAQAYADAVDAGPIRVVAIADAGMLGNGLHPTQGPSPKFARMAAGAAEAAPVELTPDDIAVSVDVDIRCITT